MTDLRRSVEQAHHGSRVLVVRGQAGALVYDPLFGIDAHTPAATSEYGHASCPYLDGMPCEHDGSSRIRERYAERLSTDDGAFGLLEELYPRWTENPL